MQRNKDKKNKNIPLLLRHVTQAIMEDRLAQRNWLRNIPLNKELHLMPHSGAGVVVVGDFFRHRICRRIITGCSLVLSGVKQLF